MSWRHLPAGAAAALSPLAAAIKQQLCKLICTSSLFHITQHWQWSVWIVAAFQRWDSTVWSLKIWILRREQLIIISIHFCALLVHQSAYLCKQSCECVCVCVCVCVCYIQHSFINIQNCTKHTHLNKQFCFNSANTHSQVSAQGNYIQATLLHAPLLDFCRVRLGLQRAYWISAEGIRHDSNEDVVYRNSEAGINISAFFWEIMRYN